MFPLLTFLQITDLSLQALVQVVCLQHYYYVNVDVNLSFLKEENVLKKEKKI